MGTQFAEARCRVAPQENTASCPAYLRGFLFIPGIHLIEPWPRAFCVSELQRQESRPRGVELMVDVANPSAEVMAAAMGQPLQDAHHPVDAIRDLIPTYARL